MNVSVDENLNMTAGFTPGEGKGSFGTPLLSVSHDYSCVQVSQYGRDTIRMFYGKEITVGVNLLDCTSNKQDSALLKLLIDGCSAGESQYVTRAFGGLVRQVLTLHFEPVAGKDGKIITAISAAVGQVSPKSADEWREEALSLRESQRIAHIGSWSDDLNGHIEWSDETYEIFGISPSEFIPSRETFINALHPDDREKFNKWLSSTMAGVTSPLPDCRIVIPDGTIRHIRGMAQIRFDETGKPASLKGVVQDITALKKIEDERNSLLERITDAFVAIDKNWCYTYVNKRAGEIVERDPLELVGKNIWVEFPQGVGLPFYHAYHRAMKDQVYIYLEEFYAPYNRWLENHIYPSPDGLTIYFRDITERKKAEEEVKQAHREKQMLLDRINDSVISVDSEWRYTFLNKAALSTHPAGMQGTLGKVIWEVHPEMVGTIFWDKYHEAMKTGKVVELENYYTPMKIWFFVKVYPSAEGLTIFYKDITERKKAEENLDKSEKRFRALVENYDAIISVLDENFFSFYRTPSAVRLTGYTAADRKERTGLDEVHPDDQDRFKRVIAQVKATPGKAFPIVYRLKHKLGHYIWLEATYRNLLNDPAISGIVVNMRDISAQKHAEEIVKESEMRYRSLIEQASDAIFVADGAGKYLDVNSSACKLLGYSRQELLTMSGRDVLYAKEIAEKLPERLNILRSGATASSELELRRKDGTPVAVESNAKMISDGRFVAILRDITERKKTEKELARTLKELKDYKFALDQSSIVSITDQHGVITHVNENFCAISKFKREELVGKDHRMGNSGFHPKVFFKNLWDTINSGRVWRNEFKNKAKDNSFYWIDSVIVPFLNEGGVPYQYVTISTDITQRKHAEEKLIANEQRFRALIENISDAIVINDSDSKLIYQSPSVTRILGYPPEERKDKLVISYVHPDDREKFVNLYKLLHKNPGHPFPFQYRVLHKNGSYIWLEGVVTNLLHEPTIQAIVANYRDISDRKEAEERLLHERTLLRTLIDNLPDYIYVKDTKSRFLINNKADLRLMNSASEADIVGKTAIEIFGPEIGRPFHESDQVVFSTGEPVVDHEEMTVNADGKRKYLLTTKVPLKDTLNNVIGLVGISRDVTRQKEIELDLRNTNYFLESAQKVGKIGHWVSETGHQGKLHWSAETCRIFGLDPNEFDGDVNTFFRFVHPEDLNLITQSTQEAIRNRQQYSVDHRIILMDGTQKWVHEQGEVNYDANGQPAKILGIVQDITERKNAENEILKLNSELEERVILRTSQLQAANRELEAFTYSVSHDLRSPLRIIDGYSQILKEDYAEIIDAEGQRVIEIIMANAKKMGQLIDDLLNFSRIGRSELRKTQVNMKTVIEETLGELQLGGTFLPGKIKINEIDDGYCDPTLIKHVWINLLSNAIKYSSTVPSPAIEVGMVGGANKATYFVRDNGVGFDMKYYHKLFGVFQRLHGHNEFSGTGVGLAIVQRIILRHDGSVWAESQLNGGTTFFFTLD